MKTKIFSTLFAFVMMLFSCQPEKNEQAISQLRKQSNLALAAHNITDFITSFTDDIAITTGNGTVIHGKDSLTNYLSIAFKKNPGLYFVRETTAIKINKTGDRAWETGLWKGLDPKTPDWNTIGGNYSAMWVKTAGIWRIRSELFVRLY